MSDIRLTPLRYRRQMKAGRASFRVTQENTAAVYGNQSYITYGYGFTVWHTKGGWKIRAHNLNMQLGGRLQEAGLFDEIFPRRSDALAAIEWSLQSEGYREPIA